jgi:hypothetical protein
MQPEHNSMAFGRRRTIWCEPCECWPVGDLPCRLARPGGIAAVAPVADLGARDPYERRLPRSAKRQGSMRLDQGHRVDDERETRAARLGRACGLSV